MEETNETLVPQIIDDLIKINAVKTGEFILKSEIVSPIYIDLRLIFSFPQLHMKIVQALVNLGCPQYCKHVVGLPYTGIPLASLYSVATQKSLLLLRKEEKEYGTKKRVEGRYTRGDSVLLIDDIVGDGGSKVKDKTILIQNKLTCNDVHVLIDRSVRGTASDYLYRVHNLRLKSVMTITDIISRMKQVGKLSEEQENDILDFLIQV